MKKLICCLTVILSLCASAQNYQWAKRIAGACGSSIVTDQSGNAYVTGFFRNSVDFDPGPNTATLSSSGTEDIFLAKYDPAGTYLWAKKIGGPSYDIPFSIAIDAAGNLHITGYFRGTSDFDPGLAVASLSTSGFNNTFIAKYDNNGNYLWAKNLGGTGNGGSDIAVDGSGNVYVSGEFSGNPNDFDPGPGTAALTSTNGMIFFAKYDLNGNYIWAKNLGHNNFSEDGRSIATDNSGNVYLTGHHAGTADHDTGPNSYTLTSAGGTDIFFSKYDTNGNFIWARLVGGPQHDEGFAVAVDAANNVCITGFFQGTADFDGGLNSATLTSAGGKDVFFAKYDTNGNYLWAKSAGGVNNDIGTSIGLDGANNIYINGYYGTTAHFDSGSPSATLTSVSTCTETIYIAKYDSNGNYVYAYGIAGHIEYCAVYTSPFIGLSSIAVGPTGDVHVTNYFSGTADFDPGVNTANLTLVSTMPFPSAYDYNGFIAKYSAISCVGKTLNNPQKICDGESYVFNNHTYSKAGVYKDTLHTKSGCDSVIVTQLTVHKLPVITVTGNTQICIDDKVTLSANGANTFTWSNNVQGANITVTPTASQGYTVAGTDSNGCVGTLSVLVVVDACSGVERSHVADGILTVFPNPVKGVAGINVGQNTNAPVTVTIISMDGETLYQSDTQPDTSQKIHIDMNGFESGIYFLKIGQHVKKVVKE